VDPIGACVRHAVDPSFNLLVPRQRHAVDRRGSAAKKGGGADQFTLPR
jgi:hypothetical protein